MHILLLILVPLVWIGCAMLSAQVVITLLDKLTLADLIMCVLFGPLALIGVLFVKFLDRAGEVVVFRKGDLTKLKKAIPPKK